MDNMVERAIVLATEAHTGQLDKIGEPYILHPLRVMLAVPPQPVLRAVAVMHDVLEDCETITAELLLADGWPVEVVRALVAISREPDESYMDFIQRVRRNQIAREVKPYDLNDNLDERRLGQLDPIERRKKYRRYNDALRALR